MQGITVKNVTWSKDRVDLKSIRRDVFVLEQGVDQDLEWDGKDEEAEHYLAYIDGEAVGCARLLDHKKIGRMAVLKLYRGKGIGKEILDHIKRHASQKRYTLLQLSAQCHAYEFYSRSGFNACSQPYIDAGMAHIDMECRVFSQEESQYQYAFSQDQNIYHGNSTIETAGFFEIMLSQCRRALTLSINDLSHPLTHDPQLLSKISQLARQQKHFKAYILLNNYHASHNDHPLFKLMHKLPSFVKIRNSTENIPNQFLVDGTAWFNLNGNASKVCYSDRSRTKQFMEQFNRSWHQAKELQGARRLSI